MVGSGQALCQVPSCGHNAKHPVHGNVLGSNLYEWTVIHREGNRVKDLGSMSTQPSLWFPTKLPNLPNNSQQHGEKRGEGQIYSNGLSLLPIGGSAK